MKASSYIERVGHWLTTKDFTAVRINVYQFAGPEPVTSMVVGDPTKISEPLVRAHSRCLYGEVLNSLDCDCRSQIDLSMKLMKAEGAGVFIYLEQEGRGCGLLNKAKAFALKENEGLDTVAAYEKLGVTVDPRQYVAVAEILRDLKLTRIRLLSNNPLKVIGLRDAGIQVRQEFLRTDPTRYNIDYLMIKQLKLGHNLGLNYPC